MQPESPNNLRYSIIIGGITTALSSTPVGWSEEAVARTRSTEDFGVNQEIIVPLSFVGDGYDILQPLYLSKGQFAAAYLKIEKRTNEWDYELFYKYRLDFSKANDKLYEFEVPGIEEGLSVKLEKYKDTEYEINLPTSNKVFIDYTGASYVEKNVIQCGYGDIQRFQKPDIVSGDDAYALQGSRSVRAYNDKIAFTDANGLPYETFTFRALKTTSINLVVYPNVTITADAAFLQSTPAAGNLKLIEHNESFASPTERYTFTRTNTTTVSNNRIDTFGNTATLNSFFITAGKLYTIFYIADEKSYDMVSIDDGANCRLEISNLVASSYQNVKLEVFTYEWLISELLKKIDPDLALLPSVSDYFESTVPYVGVRELVSATPCILNIGKTNGTGKIKTTLKDVLESFHKLHCTKHDVTGNKLTITPILQAYDTTIDNGELEASNITVMHDTTHQYNKIRVGADTDDREDDDPLIYPFICEKEYSVENSLADAELDLMNNFMLDCYAIDKYVRETISQSDNKDECKFMVFCAVLDEIANYSESVSENKTETAVGSSGSPMIVVTGYSGTDTPLPTNLKFPIVGDFVSFQSGNTIIYTVPVSGYYNIDLFVNYTTNNVLQLFETSINIDGYYYVVNTLEDIETQDSLAFDGYERTYKANYFLQRGAIIYIDFKYKDITGALFTNVSFELKITNTEIGGVYNLYKNHTVSNFTGNGQTIYNIPLTPSRILNRWKEYLAISVVGSDSKLLKFQSSTIKNSGITSKCHYEAESVTEDTDFDLSDATPCFLPAIINFDTYNDYDRIFADNKYGYYTIADKKTGRTLQGYVNKTTYSVGANQTQQWELQAKEI